MWIRAFRRKPEILDRFISCWLWVPKRSWTVFLICSQCPIQQKFLTASTNKPVIPCEAELLSDWVPDFRYFRINSFGRLPLMMRLIWHFQGNRNVLTFALPQTRTAPSIFYLPCLWPSSSSNWSVMQINMEKKENFLLLYIYWLMSLLTPELSWNWIRRSV